MSPLNLILYLTAVFYFQVTVQDSQDTERRLEELEKIVKIQQQQLDDLRSRKDLQQRGLQPSGQVAFYVYLSTSPCYSNHETFIFDVQETNTGNSYNVNDGIFDAPETGIYVFTVTIGSKTREYVTAEIIVNGVLTGSVLANSEEINDIHSASTTIVVHVTAGDHVFVRRGVASSDCSIYSSSPYTWTSFSGWLYYPTETF